MFCVFKQVRRESFFWLKYKIVNEYVSLVYIRSRQYNIEVVYIKIYSYNKHMNAK